MDNSVFYPGVEGHVSSRLNSSDEKESAGVRDLYIVADPSCECRVADEDQGAEGILDDTRTRNSRHEVKGKAPI